MLIAQDPAASQYGTGIPDVHQLPHTGGPDPLTVIAVIVLLIGLGYAIRLGVAWWRFD